MDSTASDEESRFQNALEKYRTGAHRLACQEFQSLAEHHHGSKLILQYFELVQTQYVPFENLLRVISFERAAAFQLTSFRSPPIMQLFFVTILWLVAALPVQQAFGTDASIWVCTAGIPVILIWYMVLVPLNGRVQADQTGLRTARRFGENITIPWNQIRVLTWKRLSENAMEYTAYSAADQIVFVNTDMAVCALARGAPRLVHTPFDPTIYLSRALFVLAGLIGMILLGQGSLPYALLGISLLIPGVVSLFTIFMSLEPARSGMLERLLGSLFITLLGVSILIFLIVGVIAEPLDVAGEFVKSAVQLQLPDYTFLLFLGGALTLLGGKLLHRQVSGWVTKTPLDDLEVSSLLEEVDQQFADVTGT